MGSLNPKTPVGKLGASVTPQATQIQWAFERKLLIIAGLGLLLMGLVLGLFLGLVVGNR